MLAQCMSASAGGAGGGSCTNADVSRMSLRKDETERFIPGGCSEGTEMRAEGPPRPIEGIENWRESDDCRESDDGAAAGARSASELGTSGDDAFACSSPMLLRYETKPRVSLGGPESGAPSREATRRREGGAHASSGSACTADGASCGESAHDWNISRELGEKSSDATRSLKKEVLERCRLGSMPMPLWPALSTSTENGTGTPAAAFILARSSSGTSFEPERVRRRGTIPLPLPGDGPPSTEGPPASGSSTGWGTGSVGGPIEPEAFAPAEFVGTFGRSTCGPPRIFA